MNKNLVIGVLAGLLLLSAFWGQMEAGKRKALIKEQDAQQQVRAEAVISQNDLEAEVSKQEEAQQQVTMELGTAQSKVAELTEKLAEQDASLVSLQQAATETVHDAAKMKDALVAATQEQIMSQQKKIQELQVTLDETQAALAGKQAIVAEKQVIIDEKQAVIDEDVEKLASAAKIIAQEQKQLKAHQGIQAHLKDTQAKLEAVTAQLEQLEDSQIEMALESDTMRAQIIGLERIVEERSAALQATNKELENCKVNNTVLISKISEQDEDLQGLQEQKVTLAEEFAARQMKAAENGAEELPAE